MSQALLDIQNFKVQIEGKVLQEHVHLQIASGERVGLLGPSGCGKSTFLRLISGLNNTSGRVRLHQRDRETYSFPEFRRKVVWVDQRPVLLDASVRQNLTRPFSYASSTFHFPEQQAKKLFQDLELEEISWEQNAQKLSFGQQKRLCLIRALLIQPDVLLLDEPTAGLDEKNIERLGRILEEFVQMPNRGIFVVLHDEQFGRRTCDRLLQWHELSSVS